jgi:SAM-dependent methyltransferase
VRILRARRSKTTTAQWCLEPEIPPPEINYNQEAAKDAAQYVRRFKENACLRELPFLMRTAGLSPRSVLLDYGCGLGRLAYAATKYLTLEGSYFGYEPEPGALAFLRRAYAGRSNFTFGGRPLPRDEDYVAIGRDERRAGGTPAIEVDLTSFVTRPIEIQWSCSVFTHMWRESIVRVLSSISHVLAPGALCVNTWLCIDDFAAFVLRCGVADRELPFRVNGAWVYSEDNPLVCTAYELSTVRDIYKCAGHEIVEILWGSWTGRDNGVIYQDIIISRPFS